MADNDRKYRLTKRKDTKRGFVMTGGGAKGLYEAGVLQAFHMCNMEFDVITGSSIGAINSVAYAEYLFIKSELEPAADLEQVLANIDAMESYINALHSAWLTMPKVKFLDDSNEGPLGQLKDDLTEFDIDLPMLTRLIWWVTTPESDHEPMPLMDIVKLMKELFERVGTRGTLRIIRRLRAKRDPLPKILLDTYLECQGIDTALVTPKSEENLKNHFTGEHTPLTREMLNDENAAPADGPKVTLLDKSRTLKDYAEKNIDVRLTRANFRTGLLEISAYVSKKAFAEKVTSFWQFELLPEEGFPITSFRLELPGNPMAIEAALASSRYPAVFDPFPLQTIYPAEDNPENQFLYKLLDNGFANSEVREELIAQLDDDKDRQKALESQLGWLGNEDYVSFTGRFFPRTSDRYIDGGAIDNTPANSAIDAIKEEITLDPQTWRRDATLDLYTVLLHKLPEQREEEESTPSMYDVVTRTLEINSAAKLTTDANYVKAVSSYGDKAEQLAEMLLVLLEAVDDLNDQNGSDLKGELASQVRSVAKKYDGKKYDDGRQRKGHFKSVLMIRSKDDDPLRGAEEIFPRMKALCERWLDRQLPLDLNMVKIHPDEMPLHTVAFTERLGYERGKGIEMITMGCYNTLWDLRTFLEEKPKHKLDEQDEIALELIRKWTGIEEKDWPKREPDEDLAPVRMRLGKLKATWKCQREECVFHRTYCAYGSDEAGTFAKRRRKNN